MFVVLLHSTCFRNGHFNPVIKKRKRKEGRKDGVKELCVEGVHFYCLCSEISLVHLDIRGLCYTVVFNPSCPLEQPAEL